uniref:MBL fold metallo-hydrolase n=1 Tax=Fervidicoccus fontis TaxID=683846 RepID=A0A7C1I7V6_9CREN
MVFIKKYSFEYIDMFAIDVSPRNGESFIYSYILKNKVGKNECMLIDTGPMSSSGELLSLIKKLNCSFLHVFLTHIHIDHAGGSGYLVNAFNDKATVYVHPKGAQHLVDPERLWLSSLEVLGELAVSYGKPLPIPSSRVYATKDDEVLNIDGLEIRVLHTPGHAPHHQSLLLLNNLLFSGESLGMFFEEWNAALIASPPPFKYDVYNASLDRQIKLSPKLLALPHNTVVEFKDYISVHLAQLQLWEKIAKDSKNIEEFVNTILRNDVNVEKLWKTNLYILRETILTNLKGAYEAFRKQNNN